MARRALKRTAALLRNGAEMLDPPQSTMVTMPVTIRVGDSRVLAEEIVRFARRKKRDEPGTSPDE